MLKYRGFWAGSRENRETTCKKVDFSNFAENNYNFLWNSKVRKAMCQNTQRLNVFYRGSGAGSRENRETTCKKLDFSNFAVDNHDVLWNSEVRKAMRKNI